MRTLAWDSIEFGNFILITTIRLWNQCIENSMSLSPLGCDFVTSLLLLTRYRQNNCIQLFNFSMWVLFESGAKSNIHISLITGWTVYTEKYKVRGLYEGPRDSYFSYRQSNQLLRSLLPDWNFQNILGKVCAECKLMENSAKNVIIYRFRFFPESFRKFTDNFPNVTNFSRPLSIVSLPSSQKSCVLTLIESRINGPDRPYGMYRWSTFHNPANQIAAFCV